MLVCSEDCQQMIREALCRDHWDAGILRRGDAWPQSCAHCADCGTLIAVSRVCVLHSDGPCPPLVPIRTLWGFMACEALTHALEGPLPDELYDELVKASERNPDTNKFVQWIQEATEAWER